MDLASTPPFGGLKDIAGYIRLTVPDGWRFAAQDDDKRPTDWDVPLDGGRTATVKATMIPDGQPRTGSVIAEYVIRHGKRELRASLTKVLLPSIDKWWIVGPFDNPEEQGLSKVFPPEEGIDLKAEYEGKGGLKIGWKKAEREIAPGVDLTADFAINFHEFFGQEYGDAVAYGLTYLHAPADMDVVLALGSDDGVAVWLNGQEVHRNLVNRPYVARQDRVPIHQKTGTHTLLMKINQGGGGWGCGADIETPDGKPVPEVEARLTP